MLDVDLHRAANHRTPATRMALLHAKHHLPHTPRRLDPQQPLERLGTLHPASLWPIGSLSPSSMPTQQPEDPDYQGQYIDLPGDNAGLFYFFNRSNPEVLFRVQDGRAINGQWWFFMAAASQLELAVSVQDTVTGTTHTYRVPAGHLGGIADYRGTKPSGPDPRPEPEPDPEPTPDCSVRTCLLQDGRFRVKVWYLLVGDAKSRSANAVEVDLGEPAGLFTFDSGEPELLVRISDQCNWSAHYAVYAAAGTDAVSYSVAVRDTTTNELRWFRARHGDVITDSVAFPCN